MSEKFLRKRDIAAMLGTSPGVAASILASHGVHAIDFGVGRSRGLRWLESAVLSVMRDMHEAAQPAPRQSRKASPGKIPRIGLAGLKAGEVYEMLTHAQCLQ